MTLNASVSTDIWTTSASGNVMTSVELDALHARNRAEVALATAADIAARWDTMVADIRYLEGRCDSLNLDVRDLRQRVHDLETLLLALIK